MLPTSISLNTGSKNRSNSPVKERQYEGTPI
jgi:hypothetical protein